MSDATLAELARDAGLMPRWTDAFGEEQAVAPDTLRAVLRSLGLDASDERAVAASHAALSEAARALPPLVTAAVGQRVRLPAAAARYAMRLEDGRRFDGDAEPEAEGCSIPAILEPGYHEVTLGAARTVVAVAPRRCFTVGDATGGHPAWGLAVQLYALRRAGDGGLGDFAALRDFVGNAAAHGADAVTISPAHAQFSADPDRFSPYSPSSRVALNVLHAPLALAGEAAAALSRAELVDWPAAGRARLAALRDASAGMDPATRDEFRAWRAASGDSLEQHARFEAIHAHMLATGRPWYWRDWPEEYRSPASPAVQAFAAAHEAEVTAHAYMQFAADRGLAEAQRAAKSAGMAIGLIADLAVGTDPGGSHCWSRQDETLLGMTVGAPPDLMSRDGQNWGLAAFSPRGLAQRGYAAYLEMLRAALRHAGGVRIDHGLGLHRLWIVPEGAGSKDGAYISFPERDLMRLIALESLRHRAIVLAEDLGTVPEGFQDRLRDAGIDGMRVLWFERDKSDRYVPPAHWTREASAMTGTHDLATVAGWWRGRDIDWRARLDLVRDEARERRERADDRVALWDAMTASGAAHGSPPGEDEGEAVADAACRHIAGAASELVMLPVEDALALVEQPNLPGTTEGHPNWQRRLPGKAATLLDAPAPAARLRALDTARRGGARTSA